MLGEVNAQIIVKGPDGFRDAIYIPMAEYKKMSVSQVEALRAQRIENHLASLATAKEADVENTSVPVLSSAEQAAQILRDALAAVEAISPDPEPSTIQE